MDDATARELEAELRRVLALVTDALSQVEASGRSPDPEMRALHLSVARARLAHARRDPADKTPAEPLARIASLPALAPPPRGRWGRWHLVAEALTLELRDEAGRALHEVDLEECSSSARVLDLLCRFAQKDRLSPEDIGWLVRALHETLEPQNTLCSSAGQDRRLLPEQIAELARSPLVPGVQGGAERERRSTLAAPAPLRKRGLERP